MVTVRTRCGLQRLIAWVPLVQTQVWSGTNRTSGEDLYANITLWVRAPRVSSCCSYRFGPHEEHGHAPRLWGVQSHDAVVSAAHLAHGTFLSRRRVGTCRGCKECCSPPQDMATKVLMSAKDIYQNHEEWAAAGVAISSTPAGKFLLKSGSDFFTGYRKVGPRAHVPAPKCPSSFRTGGAAYGYASCPVASHAMDGVAEPTLRQACHNTAAKPQKRRRAFNPPIARCAHTASPF